MRRHYRCVLVPLLGIAASVSGAQQGTPPAATAQAPATTPAVGTPAVPPQPSTREQARAAEKNAKEKARADEKAAREAEKQQKLAAKEATYLKLQNNEITEPRFDAEGKAVKLPPCSPKDKVCQDKRKELLKEKRISMVVQDGTLTVDGWPAKARLNYDLKSFEYLYVSMPGYGTLVISPYRFANATEAKDALDGQNLTIQTGDKHVVQLSSVENLAGRQKRTLFFALDRNYTQPGEYPSVGYGSVNHAPYTWPGALPPTEAERKEFARAPEIPVGMRARLAVAPCPVVLSGAAAPAPVGGGKVQPVPAASPCATGPASGASAAAAVDAGKAEPR